MTAQNSEARKRHEPIPGEAVLDAIDLLHELEWIHYEDGTVRCPDCRNHELAGHHSDCGLAHTLHILDSEVVA